MRAPTIRGIPLHCGSRRLARWVAAFALVELLAATVVVPPLFAQPPPPRSRTLNLADRPLQPEIPRSVLEAKRYVDGPVDQMPILYKYWGLRQQTPNDCAPLAAGKVFVLHIFADDSTTHWENSDWPWVNDRDAMAGYCKEACDWLADEAPGDGNLTFSNHGSGSFTYYYYDVDLSENVPNGSDDGTDWIEHAVEAVPYGDYDLSGTAIDDLIEGLIAAYYPDYDWGIVLFHVNKRGRSWASPWRNGTAIYPRDNYGTNEWGSVFAHEILHLFGSEDEYEEGGACPDYQCTDTVPNNWIEWLYVNGNCEDCSNHDTKCIMRTTSRSWFFGVDNTICTYTKGQIGWRDGDDDDKPDFKEAAPYSWMTTPAQSTAEADILVQGRAWSPYSDIDSVAYQVGAVVNPANWSFVPAPYDLAWDEHEEAVNITIPLPSDGDHTVWLKAHNASGNWQNSRLHSRTFRRDTQGPNAPTLTASPNINPNLWYDTQNITVSWWGSSDVSGVSGYGRTIDIYPNTYAPETNLGLGTNTNFAPPGTGVWYAHVAAVDALGNWGPTTHFRLRVDRTAPSAPIIQSGTHQQLVWSNQSAGHFHWHADDVHSHVGGYDWRLDDAPTTQLSGVAYEDTQKSLTLGNGIRYLHVAAQDSAGNWGSTSHYQVRVQVTPPAAPAPYLVNPSPGLAWYKVTGVTFGWNEPATPPGIAGYSVNLTAGQTGQAPDTEIDTTQLQTQFTGLSSGYHTFGVRAKDNAGNWGSANYVTIGLDTSPPAAVTNLATTSHSHAVGQFHRDESANPHVTITFDAAVDAHSGLANHAIVWDTSPTTVPTFQNAQIMAQNTTIISPGLTTGNWYAHVGAVDHKENWTGAQQTAHLGPIVIDITPPPAPINFTGSSGSSNVDLIWNAVRNERVDHYIVYRSDDHDLLGTALTSSLRDTFYADQGPLNGEVYYYRVAAVDSVSLVSVPSYQVTGRPEYVSPGNATCFANLAALVAASQGGVRSDGVGGYTMHGNVTLSATDTLKLGPGARLRSTDRSGQRKLIIRGTLRAIGSAVSPVLIEAAWAQAGAWGGIDMDPPSGNCRLERATVRHGVTNVRWHGVGPDVQYCTISDASGAGLDLAVGVGATCTVQHNTVARCGGNGISVFAPGFTTTDVSWNTVEGNDDGIYWSTAWPGDPPNLLDIHNNTARDNIGDGIACGRGGATTFIQDNTVLNNDRGIVFDDEGWMITTPIIQRNLVTANASAGIHVSRQAQPDLLNNRVLSNPLYGVRSTQDGRPRLRDNVIQGSATGVRIDNSNFLVPDMGTGPSPGHNKLDQHTTAYVANLTALAMNAISNYWGSAQMNPGAVIVGPVAFVPTWNVADQPPTITVTQPAGGQQTSTSVLVTWIDSDPNPADPLTLSLFYDTDGVGLDGTGIAGASALDGLDEADSLRWDVAAVPAGVYHVYGTISDGVLTASSYGAGTVTVVHPEISAPSDTLTLQLARDGTGALDFTVRNDGGAALSGSLTEDDGGGLDVPWLALGSSTFALAVGDSATVQLSLDAADLDDNVYRGLVHLLSNDPSDSLISVPVALTVVHPAITIDPDTLAFGGASLGDSLSANVTIVNTGSDTLVVTALAGLAAPFAAELLDGDSAAPGDSLRIGVTARPAARGDFADALEITNSDPENPLATVALSLTASGPALGLPEGQHSFGSVAVGDTVSWMLSLANVGDDSLVVAGIAPSADVVLVEPAGGLSVAAGDTTEVTVRFAPRAAGAFAGYLRLTHTDPAGPDSVALSGHGRVGQAVFADTLLAFGSTSLGDTLTVTAWLHNLGDDELEATDATADVPFSVATTGAPWTIAAGDSLGVAVQFIPTHGGEQSGWLNVTTDELLGGSPRLALRGAGLVPDLTWPDTTMDFGAVPLGTTAEASVRVHNPGEGAVTLSGGLAVGSHFSLVEPPELPVVIPALDSLLVRVRFEPDSLVTRTDTLVLASPWDFLGVCRLPLLGRGIDAQPLLPFSHHDFGPVEPASAKSWGLPILNQGEAAFTVTLTSPGLPFGLSELGPLTVAGGSRVELQVTFTPAALGAWSDSVVVRWGEPPVTLGTVTLTGMGAMGDLVPPPGVVVADVFEADTTRTELSISNSGGGALFFAVIEDGTLLKKRSDAKPDPTGKPLPLARATDPRLLSRQAAKMAPPSKPPTAGADDGPRCGFALKSGPGSDWLPQVRREIDIPWADVMQPYMFVCPDSFEVALIDLFSTGLTAGVYDGRLLLLTSDAEAESTTIGLTMRVPRMRYATHDAGSIRLTVTDEGALGFFDSGQREAYGAGLHWPPGSASHLFHGSLWLADGPTRMADASYDYDFAVVPGAELALVSGEPQSTHCAFTDALAPSPLGAHVTQTTYAFATPPDDDYVILDFTLTTSVARNGVYAGLYLDVDLGQFNANGGGYVSAQRLGYMGATDGSDSTRVGIVALPGTAPRAFRLIHNPTYFYPHDDIDDAVAWGFLSAPTFDGSVPSPSDYSMVLSIGPLNLAPGRDVHVAFAVVAGGSAATLEAAAAAARAKYPDIVTYVVASELPQRFAIGAPYPNPFNPLLSVPVEAPAGGGDARVVIYDLRGRRVRTLLDGYLAEGRAVLTWDGHDGDGRACASGAYFVRFTAPQVETVRKAVLVR